MIDFFIFGLIGLTAVLVVTSINPVHSVLALILVYLESAAIFVFLGAEFVGLLLVVVYVGALAVLFLFVVMMLNLKMVELRDRYMAYVPISGLYILVFAMLVLNLFRLGGKNSSVLVESFGFNDDFVGAPLPVVNVTVEGMSWLMLLDSGFNLELVGEALFTAYVSFFLTAGFVLLVAMIGSIYLTLSHSLTVKRQDIFVQIQREHSKSVLK